MVRDLALCVLLSLLAVPAAQAQIFLQLVGQTQGPIQGDATFAGEENRIVVSSFSEGAVTILDQDTGAVVDRYRGTFNLGKIWDRSSIKLLRAQGEEELLTTCVFRLYRSPTSSPASLDRRMPMSYLTIELVGARIESYSAGGSGDSPAGESLSLTYDAIRYTYDSTGETFYDPIRGPGSGAALARQTPRPQELSGDGFEFALPEDGSVGIEITDADGRWVTTLIDDDTARAAGIVRWDATDASGRKVPAGVYTAKVRTSGAEILRRMVIGG